MSPLKAHIDVPLPPCDQGRLGALGRAVPAVDRAGAFPAAAASGHGTVLNLGVWAADGRRSVSGAPGDRAPA
jgi:hypothetical protein